MLSASDDGYRDSARVIGDHGASADADRAGGLRPEPAAQSQPEALIPSADEEWQCGHCDSAANSYEQALACCAEAKAQWKEALLAALPSRRPPVIGYMCGTDWEDELGHASDGNKVFPSAEALKRHSPCWQQCGIMEVRVSAEKVIERGSYNYALARIDAGTGETACGLDPEGTKAGLAPKPNETNV